MNKLVQTLLNNMIQDFDAMQTSQDSTKNDVALLSAQVGSICNRVDEQEEIAYDISLALVGLTDIVEVLLKNCLSQRMQITALEKQVQDLVNLHQVDYAEDGGLGEGLVNGGLTGNIYISF